MGDLGKERIAIDGTEQSSAGSGGDVGTEQSSAGSGGDVGTEQSSAGCGGDVGTEQGRCGCGRYSDAREARWFGGAHFIDRDIVFAVIGLCEGGGYCVSGGGWFGDRCL